VLWLALLLKLLHIGIAITFIAGAVGRSLILARAARAREVETAFALSQAAAPFEQMAIWGSNLILPAGMATAWAQGYAWFGLTTGWMLLATILLLSTVPLVPLVFIPRHKRFDGEMAAARASGTITPGLQAAFADRWVALARGYEYAAIVVILVLMVFKPFR
jgi:hypothetical protein